MSPVKAATVDFQIQDDGTVKFTATPVDHLGNATTLKSGTPPLAWVSDNPALTLAADPNDQSGFALSQIGTPTTLATGVNVSCSTTQPGDAAPISGAATPLDIVAGSATALTVAEQ